MATYDPGTPQAPDLPSDSQEDFLTNFQLLNEFMSVDHIPFGNVVSFATNTNPCVCTSEEHGLSNGNTVLINHFSSIVGDKVALWDINPGPYTVTFIDVNTFSINANATANPAYLANSGSFFSSAIPYGFHKKTYFPNVQASGPNTSPPLSSPYSTYYSKEQKNLAQMWFQNGMSSAFEHQMTNLPLISTSNINGKGLITPWGLRINFGQIPIPLPLSPTFNLPVPFLSEFWSIIGIPQENSSFNRLISMQSVGLDKFTVIANSGGFRAWYIALGV